MANKKHPFYRIHFLSQNEIYEIYAKHVSQSNMLGFIEISDLVFGETGTVLVDPSAERLRNEFTGVNRFYVPINCVLRIDEVEKQGTVKIIDNKGGGTTKITPFPIYSGKNK